MNMAPANPTNPSDLYNLRWNSYHLNLSHIIWQLKNQENLVDVSLSSEGEFLRAHKLILSASSSYFQKVFDYHRSPDALIFLSGVKFKDLKLIVQFMYQGEVKVAESDLEDFLKLGKALEVKGLCTLDCPDPSSTTNQSEELSSIAKVSNEKKSVTKKSNEPKTVLSPVLPSPVPHFPPPKKRKIMTMPEQPEPSKAATTEAINDNPTDNHSIPRPPNAFMLFACQWRKKLAVEYPNESTKTISVRLGNMWKGLSQETKDAFYEDARKAEEEHKLKFPRYWLSSLSSIKSKEAKHRKEATTGRHINTDEIINLHSSESLDDDLIEIKSEEIFVENLD